MYTVAVLGGRKGGQMPPQIAPPPKRGFQFAQTAYGFTQFKDMAYLLTAIINGFTLVL